MRGLPPVDIVPDYFAFAGGLDLVTPAMRKAPGTLIDALNYEPSVDGGYSRILGYEALDGRVAPSSARAEAVACTLSVIPAPGAVLTIGAVTCVFIKVIDGGILVSQASAAVPSNTSIVDGPVIGFTASSASVPYAITPELEAQWLVDAADYYRSLIGPVPGDGPVRGAWIYDDVVYAWRDNVGATAGAMHKATSSGWAAVDLGEEVSFTNANVSVGEGDTLTQGSAEATIARVVLETGSLLSGTNTGRLILAGRNAHNFTAGAATSTGGGTLTLGGEQSAITLPPGGRYRLRNWNFGGQSSTQRMYGVNGVGRAFEFDGAVFAPISTKAAVDTPSHVETSRAYLWLGLRSSVFFSGPGAPYIFDATVGAGEIAAGGDITALRAMQGKAMGVFTKEVCQVILGAVKADFELETIAPDAGAKNGIVGVVTDTYVLDDRGLASLQATQAYGNFTYAMMSRRIQPLTDEKRTLAVDSFVVHSKDQMRIFFSDGFVILMHRNARGRAEFTPLQYGFLTFCSSNCEDAAGTERLLVGAEDGFVYELDVGSTFNGEPIEAYCSIAYFHAKSPRVRKHFRFAVLEMTANLFSSLRVIADFSYGSPEAQTVVQDGVYALGSGGQWDISNWDEFFWDAAAVDQPKFRIGGHGTNVSMTFYSNTKLDFGHTLQGATVMHTSRRLQR